MAKVSNPGPVPFILPTLHVAPAGGSVEVNNETLRECMRSIGGLVAAGYLSVEWDVEALPELDPKPARKGKAPETST